MRRETGEAKKKVRYVGALTFLGEKRGCTYLDAHICRPRYKARTLSERILDDIRHNRGRMASKRHLEHVVLAPNCLAPSDFCAIQALIVAVQASSQFVHALHTTMMYAATVAIDHPPSDRHNSVALLLTVNAHANFYDSS